MRKDRYKFLVVSLSVLLVPFFVVANASAGLLADYSSTSAGGNQSVATYSTTHWVSDVHFAVYDYAAGDPLAGESGFQDFSPNPISVFPLIDPSDVTSSISVGANDYLYIYQIDHDVNAIADINSFSVSILPGAESSITSVGYTNDTNVNIFGLGSGNADDGPFFADFTPPGGVFYSYSGNNVEAGEESFTMFFTSTEAPTFNSSTLSNAGESDIQFVPTPAPEPVSSILFLTGGATLGFRRFRKRNK